MFRHASYAFVCVYVCACVSSGVSRSLLLYVSALPPRARAREGGGMKASHKRQLTRRGVFGWDRNVAVPSSVSPPNNSKKRNTRKPVAHRRGPFQGHRYKGEDGYLPLRQRAPPLAATPFCCCCSCALLSAACVSSGDADCAMQRASAGEPPRVHCPAFFFLPRRENVYRPGQLVSSQQQKRPRSTRLKSCLPHHLACLAGHCWAAAVPTPLLHLLSSFPISFAMALLARSRTATCRSVTFRSHTHSYTHTHLYASAS